MRKVLLLLFLLGTYGIAQKTIQLEEGQASPDASLNDVAWIAGHWKGEALGGIAEEIWSPPMGGSMMFVFRLVNDDKVTFYETGYIKQVGATLIMQLKHFDSNLKGWEEKEETIDFKLVKLEKDKAFFEGLTFQKVGEDELQIIVLIDDGKNKEEALFQLKKREN